MSDVFLMTCTWLQTTLLGGLPSRLVHEHREDVRGELLGVQPRHHGLEHFRDRQGLRAGRRRRRREGTCVQTSSEYSVPKITETLQYFERFAIVGCN